MITQADNSIARDPRERFLAMLPKIRARANAAFRGCRPAQREDLVAEVVAGAYCAFARLVERGKIELAHPTPLARYAVRQARGGRRVGAKLNIRDVSSDYCRKHKEIPLERLDRFDRRAEEWREVVVEDRQAAPADVAACRVDFAEWLRRLPARKARLARALAGGESTKEAARIFRISPARVSQVRRELKESWEAFQGGRRSEAAGA